MIGREEENIGRIGLSVSILYSLAKQQLQQQQQQQQQQQRAFGFLGRKNEKMETLSKLKIINQKLYIYIYIVSVATDEGPSPKLALSEGGSRGNIES